ncbi:hypothetical protein [Novipirellula caenicola]|uniref:Uncharacterized protein n=1 Tax=Novipirellula caenicola TaxID=1536901 RepID=A0ABP9W3K3_9BACT
MKQNSIAFSAFVTLLVLGSFAFLNLDGYQLHFASPWGGIGEMAGEPPTHNWAHGWPVAFAVRSSVYSISTGRGVTVASFTGGYSLYSRWPIDESPIAAFSGMAATCDMLLGIVLAIGTYAGTRKLVGDIQIRLRFGLRTLLACVFAFAILLAFRNWLFPTRYVIELLAATVVGFGACVSVIAIPLHLRRSTVQKRTPTPFEATS